MKSGFYYENSDIVQVGDRVKFAGGRDGVVKELLLPGADLLNSLCVPLAV